MRTLHPYQTKAIADLREALRSGSKRPMLMAPTGAGKTVIAAEIIQGALAKGRRVTFTVPTIGLVDQTARDFFGVGIRDVGIMQADHHMTDPTQPVQIASIQTLRRRRTPKTDLWLVDEAHRLDKGMTEIMGAEEWAGVPFIGLSATPWAKGLGRLYDRLIIATTTAELIEAGYLSPFRAFAPAHPDLTGVRTVAGDYQVGQLSEAMQRKTLVGDIVTTWLDRGEGRATFVFCVDCAHARAVHRQFTMAGVACDYLDGETPALDREAIRGRFARGETKVVCNVGVLTTGIDWDVRCIVLARPTKSEMLYVQMIGRGLRIADGKADCLILDHSDTTLRLGFVTSILHSHLDDGTMNGEGKEREPPKPHECKGCSFLMDPGVWTCPACGLERQKRLANVETVGGEIIELSGRASAKRNRSEGWTEKVAWIAGLRAYQVLTGKKSGWVAHAYKERYGVWPNDPMVKYAAPARSVPPEVSSWIRSRQIAWAHRKDRASA